MNHNELVGHLQDKICGIRDLIELNIPQKGLCEDDCQRTFLINRLNALEFAVNGIEPDDLYDSPD